MVSQLIQHERIETTLPKAKELRRVADQAVTLAKEVTAIVLVRASVTSLWSNLLLLNCYMYTCSYLRCLQPPIAVQMFTSTHSYALLTPLRCDMFFFYISVQGTLHARRRAAGLIPEKDSLIKLFGPLAARYKDRQGGYTRILRSGRRPSDAAQMAFIEYVDREGELRPARPPRPSLLPSAAQAVLDHESSEAAVQQQQRQL
jgi:ribosomal protein L17